MSRQRHRRNKTFSLYIWHRYAGLSAALFVIFISVTGIALNHTDDLSLKKQHIGNRFVLQHYNVQAPAKIIRFTTKKHTITQADDALLINNDNAISIEKTLVGAVEYGEFTLVALTDKLLLIDADNQLIETLSELDGVPKTVERIGLNEQRQVNIRAGNKTLLLSENLSLNTAPFNNTIKWSKSDTLSAEDKNNITTRYQSGIISVETLMLDIHSGRFFGSYGALFFDLVGIILLFLAVTGIIIWLRQRPKNH